MAFGACDIDECPVSVDGVFTAGLWHTWPWVLHRQRSHQLHGLQKPVVPGR